MPFFYAKASDHGSTRVSLGVDNGDNLVGSSLGLPLAVLVQVEVADWA